MNSQFENVEAVKEALRNIVNEHGIELFKDAKRFTGLLNDYMPDFEKERRLIRTVIANNVISQMVDEPDQKLAIVKAREYMLNDMFLSAIAAEFVLECFTYMLGWPFTPEVRETPSHSSPSHEAKSAQNPAVNNNAPEKELKPKPLKRFDAIKYKLFSNVKVPEGYTQIESFAFDGYGFLKTIRIPSTCKVIGEYAFSECKKLRAVELPETLRVIQKGAFSSCASLERGEIPWGVTAIEEGSFSFCSNLEDIIIPASVSSIGDEAFEGCETLRDVVLPETIKFIGNNVFAFCPAITIQCRENSYVHKFCMTNGIHFEFIR